MANKILLILLIPIILFSCSKSIYSGINTANIVIYPPPPDTARIQFLKRISSSQDLNAKKKSFTSFLFGESENIAINKPYGIAMHKGRIFVCDTYIRGIDIIDLEKNSFEQFIPKGKGELKIPVNCFIDEDGNMYVADSERKQVVIFDEKGNYLTHIGESQNFKPVDVSILHDQIWITNLAGHQIYVYSTDSAHRLLKRFPEVNLSDPGNLFSPTNICVTENKVYVTDFGDFKVKIYSLDGKFISSIGSNGQNLGQFTRPKGIAVDRDSNLFVVDAGFENIQVFNKDSKLLLFFGGSYKGPGDMWLPAKVIVDYDNLRYFQKFVDPGYLLKYLILVTNQFGPDKLSIYGAVEPAKGGTVLATQQGRKSPKKRG